MLSVSESFAIGLRLFYCYTDFLLVRVLALVPDRAIEELCLGLEVSVTTSRKVLNTTVSVWQFD